ncbi:hypothetical protein MPTK1_8g01300 [Marchantia polymorpha subsp. ruderalis]|uniref:Uncharacterized protein n=1 Tax=Marchantia polymorpha TaxID=3197 RepID=A0A2R6WR97_MARPO|nr:hypothetical protein MARPO_0064s0068 [Marchantia polymorpha]BBN18285.1 hypothetical protein Mp_8g01300 [Marchantia polymorpha subsp. ruderalis]|eukprot:PTQ36387.1 hypothetical protein MARPO_0064s0068 [Marchantia polymorpha]
MAKQQQQQLLRRACTLDERHNVSRESDPSTLSGSNLIQSDPMSSFSIPGANKMLERAAIRGRSEASSCEENGRFFWRRMLRSTRMSAPAKG